jgi:hypothetical protein
LTPILHSFALDRRRVRVLRKFASPLNLPLAILVPLCFGLLHVELGRLNQHSSLEPAAAFVPRIADYVGKA